ncbi:MAG: RAMP superfamily CRISPR-associated protein [Candidatus Hodarchaeales archaeon]|jgi:CRISPR/Cas system CSM-associated protein Csm3 (group 7 of RAMP superfamily)
MAATRKEKVPNQRFFDNIDEDMPQLLLLIEAYTHMSKTLNGPVQKGCYMPKLHDVQIPYTGEIRDLKTKKKKKISKMKSLTVKQPKSSSFKGIFRHNASKVCRKAGIEVCHSTGKLEDKEGNWLLPEGFHPLGWCVEKIRKQVLNNKTKAEKEKLRTLMDSFTNIGQPCIMHRIFGSMHFKSRLEVEVKPIIRSVDLPKSITEKDKERLLTRFQLAHFATEDRNVMTFEGKPVQNFLEEFFSGAVHFSVNVTQLALEELGLVLNALRIMNRLGRGATSGYGRFYVDGFELVQRQEVLQEEFEENRVRFYYAIVDKPQAEHMQQALLKWQAYREAYHNSHKK